VLLFSISSKNIDNISSWSHLAYLLNANIFYDNHILARHNCLTGQADSFLCYSYKVDVSVENAIQIAYD